MFQVFYKSDVGQKRKNNQDSIGINEALKLFVIADGMGGHKGGETASRQTVKIIEACFEKKKKIKDPEVMILEAFKKANQEVYLQSVEEENLRGMGTTCSLIFLDDKIHMGHVGDSRVYLIKDDIKQVSVDHTLVERLIAKGEIKREEGLNHPQKHMITRALGTATELKVDYAVFNLDEAKHILICSDGLTGKVEDCEIFKIIKDNPDQSGVDELVKLANDRGGDDNISVVLLSSVDCI